MAATAYDEVDVTHLQHICVYMSVCACVFVYHTLAFKISMDSFLH